MNAPSLLSDTEWLFLSLAAVALFGFLAFVAIPAPAEYPSDWPADDHCLWAVEPGVATDCDLLPYERID